MQYRSTAAVVPNTNYKISVEILMSNKSSSKLLVNRVLVDDVDLGKCTPEAVKDDCTFVPCSSLTEVDNLISSDTGVINIAIEFEGHSWGCNCDTQSWMCSKHRETLKQIPMVAVGKITLTKQGSYKTGIIIL